MLHGHDGAARDVAVLLLASLISDKRLGGVVVIVRWAAAGWLVITLVAGRTGPPILVGGAAAFVGAFLAIVWLPGGHHLLLGRFTRREIGVGVLLPQRHGCGTVPTGTPAFSSTHPARQARHDIPHPTRLNCSVWEWVEVLRNQIVHVSPAENTTRNQDAVQPAVRVLSAPVVVAVRVMIARGASETWTPSTQRGEHHGIRGPDVFL